MFRCERCGSRYSASHAAAIENCPRCLIRERVSTPLVFKAFEQNDREVTEAHASKRGLEPHRGSPIAT